MPQKKIALQIIEESLNELESPKGSLLSAIQKLQRASRIVNDEDKRIWCSIQLADSEYVRPLKKHLDFLLNNQNSKSKKTIAESDKLTHKLDDLQLNEAIHYSKEELNIKATESGGGYVNIGFVEERYEDLVKMKKVMTVLTIK